MNAYICYLVHGEWGDWSQFSECSVTCGMGTQRRLRFCNNPSPSNGGEYCPGDDGDVIKCSDLDICPGKFDFSFFCVLSFLPFC